MRKLVAVALTGAMFLLGGCDDDRESDVAGAGDSAVTDDFEVGDEFDRLDANGDSYLDTDEIAEWADQAGTFDEWDEDSDSELDPDEIGGNAFDLWDADANGKITQDEWNEGTEVWYPNDSELIVWNDLDRDGDSEIDVDEFTERFDWSVLGETWTSNSFDEETFKNAYFELYDSDNDGKVSQSEWVSGAAVFGTPAEA